nr:hypothetical protein [Antarcticibacterium sp. 1MA-6-2]
MTSEHRLVYRFEEDSLLIAACCNITESKGVISKAFSEKFSPHQKQHKYNG